MLGGGAGSRPERAGPPDTLSSAPGELTPAAEASLPVVTHTVAKQTRPPRDLVAAHVPAPQMRGHTEPSPFTGTPDYMGRGTDLPSQAH